MQPDSQAATLEPIAAAELAANQDRVVHASGWRPVRERWRAGLAVRSHVAFALVVSVIWTGLYSTAFWQQTLAAMWHPSAGSALFLTSLFVLAVTVQASMLLLLPGRLLRPVVSVLFVIAALSSYFSSAYGAIMNKDMMRNVFETDPAEVGNLLSVALYVHVLLLGLIPAILVWRVRLPATHFGSQLRQRSLVLGLGWMLSIASVFGASANYAVFLREHKPIRYALVPAAPVASTFGLLGDLGRGSPAGPLLNPGGRVQHVGTAHARPLVMLLVIGETARAANFELGGYPRATNPRLSGLDGLVYFDRAQSCGTSTAISVPCMFSPLGQAQFNVNQADRYANLLDALVSAGFNVEWRDNNAGCKGVCARIPTKLYSRDTDPGLCTQSYCFDEIMLQDFATQLDHIDHDTVIVFHQIGSHGPAYAERYPPQFEVFKPTCRSNELQHCTGQEIVNAYDNTIAYADYVLSRQIQALEHASDHVDSMLIYLSDHGESLGEGGVYLHGLPYAFAPEVQKQVPLLVWTSESYRGRVDLDEACLRRHAHDAVSHDNLYHTILGAADLRNDVYDASLDLLSECRRPRHLS
jgi:lipid A ethanolaminephosphotransferase